jgi:hypothetical protein
MILVEQNFLCLTAVELLYLWPAEFLVFCFPGLLVSIFEDFIIPYYREELSYCSSSTF